MEQRANKFIALLVKKFNNADLSEAELKEAYLTVVTTLKGGLLKTELIKNSNRYQRDFERRCQTGKNIQLKSPNSPNTEFALLKSCCQKAQSRLHVLTPACPQYTQLTEQLHKIERKKELLYPELGALCSLLCTREDISALTNTMVIIFSVLQPAVESCLDTNDKTRCRQLRRELHNLLSFLHIKRCILDTKQNKIQTDTGCVKYTDIMASLLSLYLDLSLSMLRCDIKESDISTSDLCGFVSHLLPDLSLLDVLLQLSGFTSSDQEIILPIARKCLLAVPDPLDYKIYTKFMVCAHTVVTAMGEEAGDISQVAETLSAPKGYIEWLRKQNIEIVDNLPEDRKFKGRTISRFIMGEGKAELMEALLDCVTEELPNPASDQTDGGKEICHDTVSASADSEDTPLFFVDTTGQKTKQQLEKEKLSQSDEDKTSNHGDVEIIEVDFSAFPRQPEVEAREWGDNSSDEDSHSSEDQSSIEELPAESITPSKRPRLGRVATRSTSKPLRHSHETTEYNLRKKMPSDSCPGCC